MDAKYADILNTHPARAGFENQMSKFYTFQDAVNDVASASDAELERWIQRAIDSGDYARAGQRIAYLSFRRTGQMCLPTFRLRCEVEEF